MKRTIIFFIAIIALSSCQKLYNCSCNETTTHIYIPGEPTSHNATSYIKKGNRKQLTQECNSHEVFYQDSIKIIATDCTLEEE